MTFAAKVSRSGRTRSKHGCVPRGHDRQRARPGARDAPAHRRVEVLDAACGEQGRGLGGDRGAGRGGVDERPQRSARAGRAHRATARDDVRRRQAGEHGLGRPGDTRPPRRRAPRGPRRAPSPRRGCRTRRARGRRRATPPPSATPSRPARRSRRVQVRSCPVLGCGSAVRGPGRRRRLAPRPPRLLEEHRVGDAKGLHRGGHAAVDRRLQQHLLDLLARAAVPDRAADVDAQLVRAVQGGEDAEVDEAALRGSSPGRPQTAPQQCSVTKSCITRVKSLAPASDRATCSSPSTSRRILRPCS